MLRNFVLACLAVALLAAAALLAGCDSRPEPARKVQTVKLLPETPPPPPPKPPPDKPPPPKPEDKPQPQEAPKPEPVREAQQLKEEGPAGDGPGNGLGVGSVAQDYSDQKIGQGTQLGGGGAVDVSARLAANAFGQAATRALNEHLAREKALKRRDYKVRVELWFGAGGATRRAELVDSTGDAQTDEALRAALARFPGSSTPPPPGVAQPVRVLVSNRWMG